jgi:probable H4MPT-linked C1 transfer pathway protein
VPLPVVGLDIGGANLKAAHSDGSACAQPFPLWKQPETLAPALEKLVARMPAADHIAAAMTGELCDCFASKSEGVRHIIGALRKAFPRHSVWLWRNDARLVAIDQVGEDYLSLAAANWSAQASFIGRLIPRGAAVLVDMGSTTTDIIPLFDGRPMPKGRTDRERLRAGELVYLGASRTPLCALLGPGYAAEWFATTLDAYLLLGVTPENAQDSGTADSRPATRLFARARVARMLCADTGDLTEDEILEIATRADWVLTQAVRTAIDKVSRSLAIPIQTLFISGSGEDVLWRIATKLDTALPPHVESFREKFGPNLSTGACAYALAVLTQDYLSREQSTGS